MYFIYTLFAAWVLYSPFMIALQGKYCFHYKVNIVTWQFSASLRWCQFEWDAVVEAECSVNVLGFKCPSLPQPINGHMSCTTGGANDDHDYNATYTCRLQCNDGYGPFSAPADVTGHVCSSTANYSWFPPFLKSTGAYLCLSESSAYLPVSILCVMVLLSVCLLQMLMTMEILGSSRCPIYLFSSLKYNLQSCRRTSR